MGPDPPRNGISKRPACKTAIAAVTADHALHNRQPDSRARKLGTLVQALKRPKEFIGIGHVETGSVIPNIKGAGAVVSSPAEFDSCAGTRELYGIRQQVGQRDL